MMRARARFSRASGRCCIGGRSPRMRCRIGWTAAGTAADKLHDFYSGIRLSLAEMLISPEFLLRFRSMEPDPSASGPGAHERLRQGLAS